MSEPDRAIELDPALYRSVVDASSDGIVVTDASRDDHPIVYVNAAFERMTGYRAQEVLGRNGRFLQGDDRSQPERKKLRRAVADGLSCSVLLRNYRKDGSLFWNELTVSPIRERSGRATHWIGYLRDVSARVRLEKAFAERQEELDQASRARARLETHDELTEVAGRRFFLEALAREWKRAARDGAHVALLLLDVDDFGGINDRRGHCVADQCLKGVAAALESVLKRPADLLARYAGDEFAALLPDTDLDGARTVAESMRAAVQAKDALDGLPLGDVAVTVSIGAACLRPTPGLASEELVTSAARALRKARESGGDRVEAWSPDDAAVPVA